MPAATIDTLEIAIQVQSDDAERRLDRFLEKLRAIGSMTNGAGTVSARIRDITPDTVGLDTAAKRIARIGDAASSSGSRIRAFSKDITDSGDAASHSVSGLSKFLDTLRRVAYMRFVRSILRGIVSAFKEGITNLYQWSSAVNGTFAASMDRIATSTQYLKNSLGAMLAPLIEALAPVLEWVISRIVDVINWITALFAALSGSSTYTVAKKVSTTWGDTTKQIKTGTDSARESVEQLKRSILGFDEIDKLDGGDIAGGGSGGSGTGTSGPSTTSMFEERPLDGWILGLSNFISGAKAAISALIAPLVAAFGAVKVVVDGIVEKTREWLNDLAKAGKAPIQIAVSLVRSGWLTLKDWVRSFGAAAVGVAVSVTTSATALWKSLQVAWAALGEKALSVRVVIATSAKSLWRSIQAGWAALGAKALSVTVAPVTSAKALWTTLKAAWGPAKDHVLQVSVAISTTAGTLWKSLVSAWGAASTHVLSVAAQITTTASALWQSVKSGWAALGTKVLSVGVVISTAAATLWKSVKEGWNAIGNKALSCTAAISTTAASLWNGLKTSWLAIQNRVVQFSVSISTTAQSLWNGLKNAWRAVENKILQFSVSIATTAQSLWNGLKNAWRAVENKILQFSVSIATTAQSLWNGLKNAWEAVPDKVLSFGVKISTAISRLWDWLKENWAKVALAALGFAVAIATPWGTIATALAGLWADVMASFGGSLAFGIAPSMNGSGALKTPQEVKNELDANVIKPISELLNEQDYQVYMTAHANPGNGLSRKQAYGGGLELSPIDSITSSVDVGTNPGNGLTAKTNGLALSPVESTSTSVNVGLSPVWSLITGILSFLGLTNLTTTVKVNLEKNDSTWRDQGLEKWIGTDSKTVNIKLDKYNYEWDRYSLSRWIGPDEKQVSVKLDKYNWEWDRYGLSTWIGSDSKWVTIYLSKGNFWDLSSWIGSSVTVSVNLKKGGGVVYSNGYTASFAEGGAISNGVARKFSQIPRYAGGTSDAHGTLFLAGEAGPEIVGHVGGRTEILNQSQLAQTMFAAVRNAMSGVRIGGHIDNAVSGGGSEADYEMMYRAMYDAFTDAMAGSNERDREKVALMREIAAKEFTAEVTAASVNRAQTRMNRRAGTTIVPVGT